MGRKVAKILLYLSVSVLVLLIAAAVFTQTPLFKTTLCSTLYTLAERNLNAAVYIGEISGNMLTGFSVDTVAVYVDNASFVEAGRITVRYDPLALWNKRVSLVSLAIDNPSVTLIRFPDSSWNLDHIAKIPADTAPSSWIVALKNAKIRNGRFHLIDSTSIDGTERYTSAGSRVFDFAAMNVKNVDVELGGTYSAEEQSVSVRNISLESPREHFSLRKFSAEIRHTAGEAEVSRLILATENSHIECSVGMSSLDVFAIKRIEDLRLVPVHVLLSSTTIDAEELQRFLPELNFLRGRIYFNVALGGEFGNIQIQRCEATFQNSTVRLTGALVNLHRPKELKIDVTSAGSIISPSDVPQLMPEYKIPDFGALGEILMDFHYTGKPLDFVADASVETGYGSLAAHCALDLTGPIMKYKATASAGSLNLAPILSVLPLQSHLNFHGSIEGQGTSIGDIFSRAEVRIDTSSIYGIPISHASFQVSAGNRHIKGAWEVRSPSGDFDLTSDFDYPMNEKPLYRIVGSVNHLDLSVVLKDLHYASDCTFDLDYTSDNIVIEDADASLSLRIHASQFGAHSFDSVAATVRVHQDSLRGKTVECNSPIADVVLDGDFTIAGIVGLLEKHINGVQQAFLRERSQFDSSFVSPRYHADRSSDEMLRDISTQRVHYVAQLKNLEPLAIFFDENPFGAVGRVEGVLRGSADTIYVNGTAALRSGNYTPSDRPILLENVSLSYSLDALTSENFLSASDKALFLFQCSAVNAYIGETQIRAPVVDIAYGNGLVRFSVSGGVDTTMKVGIDGRLRVEPKVLQCSLDHVSARYQGYEINNVSPVTARITASGMALDSVQWYHQDEYATLGGTVEFSGKIDALLHVTNFTLSNIFHFGTSPDFKQSALDFGGTAEARISLRGTMREPVILAEIGVADMTFRKTYFGFAHGIIRYENLNAAVQIDLSRSSDASETKQLAIAGFVPVNLSFAPAEKRFDIEGLDVWFKTTKFQMSILDPFIPEIDKMQGRLESVIHSTGTLAEPRLSGTVEMFDAQFLSTMNGIIYKAAGKVEFSENKALFSQFTIRNLPVDYAPGKADVSGYIVMKGFVPSEYHLEVKGELLALEKNLRTSAQEVYGDLVASTDNNGLRFEGSYEHSLISGTIFVKQASLYFPPTRQSSYAISTRDMNIVVVDDTSKLAADSILSARNLLAFLARRSNMKYVYESTFLDGLGYEVTIQTQGSVQIRMIFNPATNEELFADLQGKLTLRKESKGGVKLIGSITVSERSHYQFYKKFDATGTFTFTGIPDNPQLNIKATYKGTHVKRDWHAGDSRDSTEKVIVSLFITGTRSEPTIKIGLSVLDDNGNEIEQTGDVQSDALAFLLTSSPSTPGRFRDELRSNDKEGIANIVGGSLGGSYISGMLSGILMDFLRSNNITWVSGVEVRYVGASPDLRLSGEVYDAYWSFGGRVFNNINNANVSVQFPLGPMIGSEKLRNFVFELERKVEALEVTELSRPISGARLYYRIIF